jgi:AcrR family transcriptional regulator
LHKFDTLRTLSTLLGDLECEAMAHAAAVRAPGRPRSDATRRSILEAAYALLTERGPHAFTIEGVAARSGSAKTTIYRWWPSKGALAIDAFLDANAEALEFAHDGTALEQLYAQLMSVLRVFHSPAGKVIAGIVAEMQGDDELRLAYLERFIEPRRRAIAAIMERGLAGGELRADLDIEATMDLLYGSIYWRLLGCAGSLDQAWIDRLLVVLMRGIAPRAETA